MLQAIEAEIGPDGRVTLLEPVRLPRTVRAVVTLLSPIEISTPARGSGAAMLALLDSPEFANAPSGDPEQMEKDIAANRDDWGE